MHFTISLKENIYVWSHESDSPIHLMNKLTPDLIKYKEGQEQETFGDALGPEIALSFIDQKHRLNILKIKQSSKEFRETRVDGIGYFKMLHLIEGEEKIDQPEINIRRSGRATQISETKLGYRYGNGNVQGSWDQTNNVYEKNSEDEEKSTTTGGQKDSTGLERSFNQRADMKRSGPNVTQIRPFQEHTQDKDSNLTSNPQIVPIQPNKPKVPSPSLSPSDDSSSSKSSKSLDLEDNCPVYVPLSTRNQVIEIEPKKS